MHLMRWLTNFYDFSFKWTAKAGIGIHPTKSLLSQLVNFINAIWHFCFKLGKNGTETYGILQTDFEASCMNRTSVFEFLSGIRDFFEWHKRFKEGGESVRDYERRGRSKKVNTPQLIGQRVRVRVRVTMLRF